MAIRTNRKIKEENGKVYVRILRRKYEKGDYLPPSSPRYLYLMARHLQRKRLFLVQTGYFGAANLSIRDLLTY